MGFSRCKRPIQFGEKNMTGKTRKPHWRLLWLLIVFSLLLWGCVTPETTQDEKAPPAPVLESITLITEGSRSVIVVAGSAETTTSPSFALPSPPRICLDIRGIPGSALSRSLKAESGPVREVTVQDRDSEYTGLVIYLREEGSDCAVTTDGTSTVITIGPANTTKAVLPPTEAAPPPKASLFPQIQGVQVLEPKKNVTRVAISAERALQYDQPKMTGNVLSFVLKESSVSPVLVKDMETASFPGAVERIRMVSAEDTGEVAFSITLRERAPYYIKKDGNSLYVDIPFTSKKVAAAKPKAKTKEDAPVKTEQEEIAPAYTNDSKTGNTKTSSKAAIYETTSKRYAGQLMSFDFVDTDIRNILRLIGEVAGINVVWGTDVEGKISMTLKEVPWDQAIEMVLKPNGLTYQIEDDVLWVVPKAKLVDMEIAERNRKNALMAAKRLQGIFEAKIIEFIVVRNRSAKDIYDLLVGNRAETPPRMGILDIEGGESEEKEEGEEQQGKKTKIVALDLYITYDSGTNMIIANGVRAKVDKVKEFITKLDVAEKQVMIEARVVEAQTGFARDLGIRWSSLDQTAPGLQADWINTGSNSIGSTQFSTNSPASWQPNIGIAVGWLTGGGLGSIALDASLALAEEDQKINILSAPKVMTVNGGEAFVSRGTVEYFPIRTLDTINYEQIPALLSLKVKPTVSADNSHVTMLVEVTDDKRLPAQTRTDPTTGDTQDSPPGRTQKKITSTLIVKTGETVVIGGIFQKEDETGDSGIPWLKDIPALGWLFKAERKTRAQVELLIFLTPSVVSAAGLGT